MDQTRFFAVSFRDLLMLVAGVVLSLLLRPGSADVRAASPSDMGLACGDWIMQTDQSRTDVSDDFEAFILNVKTGELIRTHNSGKEMLRVAVKK